MVKQKSVIDKLKEAGLHPQIKVMVGGAPVTSDWARQIGADGFSEDAIGSVAVAKQILNLG
jgi:methanogenic corrinoid protein MtbC1